MKRDFLVMWFTVCLIAFIVSLINKIGFYASLGWFSSMCACICLYIDCIGGIKKKSDKDGGFFILDTSGVDAVNKEKEEGR